MNAKLSTNDVETRLRESPRSNYVFIYSVMKGAVIANAAYTLTTIWNNQPRPFLVLALLLWSASVAAMILTYTSTDVGIILSNFDLTWVDTVFPFLLAILEFSLFSLLQSPASIDYWYLCFAVYMLVIAIIVHNVVRRVRPEQYRDSSLREFVEERWITQTRRDRNMAVAWSLFALACAVIEWLEPQPLPTLLSWVPPILIGIGLSIGIGVEERLRTDIRSFVALATQDSE